MQYAFRYIYQIPREHTNAAPLLGRAFHSAATWIAARKRDRKEFRPDEAKDFFSEAFLAECRGAKEVLFGDGDTPDSLDRQGRSLVDCLCESWPEEEVLEIGTAFCVPFISFGGIRLSDRILIGEFDLVVRDPEGRTVIVDWKSSARKWPVDKADRELQATVYLYAYCAERRERLDNVGFRFDVVTKTKTPSYNQYPTARKYDDFHRMLWLIQGIEKAMKADIYLPNENSYFCGDCVYGSACREWHRRQSGTISLAKAS